MAVVRDVCLLGTTITVQDFFLPLPSLAVAVITVLPGSLAVTLPDALTVATEVLLDFQVTDLLDALLGETTAFKVVDVPAASCYFPEMDREETFTLEAVR